MSREVIIVQFLLLINDKMQINLTAKDLCDSWTAHMDSLEIIQLVMDCESRFAIKIDDDKAEAIGTFNDLINLICDAKAIAV